MKRSIMNSIVASIVARNANARLAIVAALLALLLALLLAACTAPPGPPGSGVFAPENAYGSPPPAEAEIVSEAEFLALIQNPEFRWESKLAQEERLRRAEEQFAADAAELAQWQAQNPSLERFLDDPDAGRNDIVKLPGDNYLHTFDDGAGNELTIITMGQHANYRDMIAAQEMYEDPANQFTLYSNAYEQLPAEVQAQLPSPASLQGAGLSELLAAMAQLESALAGQIESLEAQALAAVQARLGGNGLELQGHDPWMPGGFPASPADEERAGAGSDRSGDSCGRAAGGVYQNFQWPMKYFITSTKNQGRRGSCVAFALTSAAETYVAVRDARWVNLSEQFLYHRIKVVWDEDDFDDGADTADMALEFAGSGYRLPYEDLWNYNPSPNRAVGGNADAAEDFIGSCIGYGERCSNTTHQGQFSCTVIQNDVYCGSAPPNPNGEGQKMSLIATVLWTNFFPPVSGELPVNTVRQFLAIGQPVVAAIQVTDGFRSPNSNGFLVSYDDNVGGGHAVHIVGYISNSQLANALPNAPSGAGGGYFIIKNSWGSCWGDGGLIYVPVNWAKEYFKNITVYLGALPSAEYQNSPPSLAITAPSNGATVAQGTINLVTFSASASDAEDGAGCCDIRWTSDVDGLLGTGATLEYGFATPGPRVITATATDSDGHYADASITLEVVNPTPVAEILAPADGEEIAMGIPYTLQGQASDVGNLGGVPCENLLWSSSKAGDPTLTGCNPQITFASLGPRTLTLTATDSFGATDTDTVGITVVPPPDLWTAVTDPKPNDLFFLTDTITLKGTLSQQFDTPATYEWRVYHGRAGQYTVVASGNVIFFVTTGTLIVPNAEWTPSQGGFSTGTVQLALYVSGANGSAESAKVPITLSKLN